MEGIREDTAVDIPLLRLLSLANIMYDKRVRNDSDAVTMVKDTGTIVVVLPIKMEQR